MSSSSSSSSYSYNYGRGRSLSGREITLMGEGSSIEPSSFLFGDRVSSP